MIRLFQNKNILFDDACFEDKSYKQEKKVKLYDNVESKQQYFEQDSRVIYEMQRNALRIAELLSTIYLIVRAVNIIIYLQVQAVSI